MKLLFSSALIIAAALATGSYAAGGSAFSSAAQSGEQIVWHSDGHWASVHLRITGPAIQPFEIDFSPADGISLPLNGPNGRFPDGTYNWELVGSPALNAQAKQALADYRAASDEHPETSAPQFAEGAVASGTFTIAKGVMMQGTEPERAQRAPAPKTAAKAEAATPSTVTPNDQVVADDFVVQGSLGAGVDSTDNEDFGFSTILLRANNLRITFDDTSTDSSFPKNDWELTANDRTVGGANYFAITDVTANAVPFKVMAGAPANSMFLDSTGNLGLGTATPSRKLHLALGDTPAIRLEQSGGNFTAQTWDVAGNEANFFVRDVTGGSRLPFRIRPGAPTSSIDIAASGNVGIGTATPSGSLNVVRSDGSAMIEVDEQSPNTVSRTMLRLRNDGPSSMRFLNTAASSDAGGGGWQAGAVDGLTFVIRPSTATQGIVEFKLERTGKLTLGGPVYATSFNTTSDRNLKEKITPVTPREVLDRVVNLPIEEWNFIGEENPGRHIGPMAQDFREQFGLGTSETTINVMDSAGVALAAIQGLHEEVASRDAEIKTLRENSETMAAQLKTLSQQVEALKKQSAAAAKDPDSL